MYGKLPKELTAKSATPALVRLKPHGARERAKILRLFFASFACFAVQTSGLPSEIHMPSFPYKRVVVVGVTSSGKSTLAEKLAKRFDLNYIELDALNWELNWQSAPLESFVLAWKKRPKPKNGSSPGIIVWCVTSSGPERKRSFGLIIRC